MKTSGHSRLQWSQYQSSAGSGFSKNENRKPLVRHGGPRSVELWYDVERMRACGSEGRCAGLSAAVCALKKPRSSIACAAGAPALQIRAKLSPEFPCGYVLGFNASSCLSDRLAEVCRASIKCLSRVRSGRLAFAAAAASQRRSPWRPAAVFTPSVTVSGPWELSRTASLLSRSLLTCELVQCRPSHFEAMPLRNALRCRPKTLQAPCAAPRWPAAGLGAAVGASDGSLRSPPENHYSVYCGGVVHFAIKFTEPG